jgi:hypothetical protein
VVLSGYGSEMSDRDRSHSYDSQSGYSKGHWRCSFRKCKPIGGAREFDKLRSVLFRS